ncbi:hypothetical protein FRUB_03030 [Fimbriiglobus ruber]|uniref:Uncharacterized protein n=1 Tax=Fimbriiglobus ruber TaxID=1908690 RepID=A0A225DQ77_9BACT|nr:hypothetical protein FRUB_03030 [Fimbriiglobus ruber]
MGNHRFVVTGVPFAGRSAVANLFRSYPDSLHDQNTQY